MLVVPQSVRLCEAATHWLGLRVPAYRVCHSPTSITPVNPQLPATTQPCSYLCIFDSNSTFASLSRLSGTPIALRNRLIRSVTRSSATSTLQVPSTLQVQSTLQVPSSQHTIHFVGHSNHSICMIITVQAYRPRQKVLKPQTRAAS